MVMQHASRSSSGPILVRAKQTNLPLGTLGCSLRKQLAFPFLVIAILKLTELAQTVQCFGNGASTGQS